MSKQTVRTELCASISGNQIREVIVDRANRGIEILTVLRTSAFVNTPHGYLADYLIVFRRKELKLEEKPVPGFTVTTSNLNRLREHALELLALIHNPAPGEESWDLAMGYALKDIGTFSDVTDQEEHGTG